ncbi:hypothetical protein Cni_G15832 [Canna indica]|uniref:CCT domain-containing protein n=1 Tax=Canna indica TaxID=4628 RepID=A0AAQ3QF52_9LILI|nr:hypothetical protein Cni_G15832 [Canna indica]
MLQDMSEPTSDDHLLIEGISSPIAAQLLDFCDDDDDCCGAGDLFSGSDHSGFFLPPYEDATSSSSAATTAVAANSPLCYPVHEVDTAQFSPLSSMCNLLDAPPAPPDPEPDLSYYPSSSSSSSAPPPAAMFSVPPTSSYITDPFDHIMLPDAISSRFPLDPAMMLHMPTMAGAGGPPCRRQQQQQQNPHPSPYEEQCYAAAGMSQTPELAGLDAPPCGFLDGVGMSAALYVGGNEPQGLFGGGMATMSAQGFFGDGADRGSMGSFGQDAMSCMYSSGDMQVNMSGGMQRLMAGCSGPARPVPTSDISTSDEPNYKVGRLSSEERKEKIERYMRKRNVRNFSKKIKYACRKTLADSRPRVRGRFAKNDELGEGSRQRSSSNEFDDDEEVSIKEEDIVDSSDILAHISGLNSFKFNYTLESWI